MLENILGKGKKAENQPPFIEVLKVGIMLLKVNA